MTPLDLVSSHAWRRTAFTTYALSLSFFEAVLLDLLVRGGARQALILSDVLGVRAALTEQGAGRAGKDYDVEPVAGIGGIFHPKISAFIGDDDCHLLVGSGNLTFRGWGGNLEVVEHLHPAFAADAIEDTAVFFERLAITDRVRHGAADHCGAIAADLRARIQGRGRNGNIRMLHSLDGSIAERLGQVATDLGGAVRLVVASPFWDGGSAIDRLATLLGLGEVHVHAHDGGTVRGNAGANWPTQVKTQVIPVRLDHLGEPKARRLHAKIFELVCKRGRIICSGSANASTAALGHGHNIEACVVRIQREPVVAWHFEPSDPPEMLLVSEPEESKDAESGVLRAVLEADEIVGQILTQMKSGTASVSQLTGEGPKNLGQTIVDEDGNFSISAPGLEIESWKGGRVAIRLRANDGRIAEGFVSIAAFAEISRRAGLNAARFLALLGGTETPDDVAVIMEFFNQHPEQLEKAGRRVSGGRSDGQATKDDPDRSIAVSELTIGNGNVLDQGIGNSGPGSAGWQRFMQHVLFAFREERGPFADSETNRKGDDDPDDDQPESVVPSLPPNRGVRRALESFQKLFDRLLHGENAGRYGYEALRLTQYVCRRLRPDVELVRNWISSLANALSRTEISDDRREEVASFYLMWLALGDGRPRAHHARAHILRSGYPIDGCVPSVDGIRSFQGMFPQSFDFAALWERIGTIRTYPEQTRSYLATYKTGEALSDCEELSRVVPAEWRTLEAALHNVAKRSRILLVGGSIDACPKCSMRLPLADAQNLRNIGIATASNCCSRILINEEI